MSDRTTLPMALERARRRVSGSTPGSPEWDAAMAELEELEGLAGLEAAGAGTEQRRSARTDPTAA